MHKTFRQGNLGISKVISKILEKGYIPLTPFGENNRYDLVYEKNSKFIKVQVKSVSLKKNNTLRVKLHSVNFNQHGSHRNHYGLNEIDEMWVYNPDKDVVFHFSLSEFIGKHGVTFRFDKTKNNQSKNVHYVSSYL